MPFDMRTVDQGTSPARVGLDPRIRLLAIGSFAIGTDMMVMPGILPMIASDLAVGVETAGHLIAAYAFAYAIGAPVFAALTARLPSNRVLLAALIAFAAASIVAALAPNYETLLGARIAAGLAAAVYSPTAYTIASTMASAAQRGAALAAVILGLSTSAVVGVPLAVAIASQVGWHGAFLTVTLLALIGIAALSLKPLPRIEHTSRLGFYQRFAPLADRRVLAALLPSLFWNAGNFTLFTYLGAMLHEHGYDNNAIASFMIAFGLGSVVGSHIGGIATDKWGARRPILILLAIGALDLGLMPWSAQTTPTLALALFMMGLVAWGTFTPQQSRLIALDPASASVNLALANSTLYAASAIGAALGAALIPSVGLTYLPMVGAALMLMAMPVMLTGVRVRLRRIPAVTSPN